VISRSVFPFSPHLLISSSGSGGKKMKEMKEMKEFSDT